jgi:hypothetical protein
MGAEKPAAAAGRFSERSLDLLAKRRRNPPVGKGLWRFVVKWAGLVLAAGRKRRLAQDEGA